MKKMGVFDFLYKSPRSKSGPPPRHHHHHHYHQQQQYRRPGYGPPGSTPSGHHKQRTITHVNKDSALPDDFNTHGRSLSYNQRKIRPKINKNYSTNDPRKQDYFNDVDDFTRLSRLENKIDSYITRYNEIADELDSIRTNLNLIQKEFKNEYDDDISDGKKNKHVVEIGDRILAKLDSFKINDDYNNQSLSPPPPPPLPQTPQPPMTNTDTVDKPNAIALLHHDQTTMAKQTRPKTLNLSPIGKIKSTSQLQQNKYDQKTTTTTTTITTSTSIPSPTRVLVTLNGMMIPPASRPVYTVARAKYAIVNDDDDDENDGGDNSYNTTNAEFIPINASAFYTSTPSMNQQQSSSFSTKRLSPIQSVDEITTIEHPVYINMSSRIRSEHPIIEHCLRRIELLRPRIMHYKSEHKFRVYKELDHEISILMNELNGIDCSKDDTIFAQDKNVALCELHNLAGVLERSIECHDNDCVICNSFMYKPEVSV
nr:uncharacterized protein LOC124491940 [Dermatophagoides farinae]